MDGYPEQETGRAQPYEMPSDQNIFVLYMPLISFHDFDLALSSRVFINLIEEIIFLSCKTYYTD